MRRLWTAAVLALTAAALWPAGAAGAALTPRNSILAPLVVRDSVRIDGVGCGVPASATLTLPAGATDVRVRRPAAGVRDRSLDAMLTGVAVQGSAVAFTAVYGGEDVCDPNESQTPPASRSWVALFEAEVGFTQRVGVVYWDPERARGTIAVRPPEVRIHFSVAARGIRWTQFGGRKAVGLGRFKSLVPCAGGCSDDGTRLRVVLTRPSRCPGLRLPGHREDAVFYAKVAFVLRERLGILEPGTEWISTKRTCPPGDIPPIPVR